MKKIFCIILCCSLIFVGCKKNNKNDGGGKSYPVKFNVSLFAQTITPIILNSSQNQYKTNTLGTLALSDIIDNLTYCVYDSNGKLLHRVQSTHASTDFGTIKDSLTPGSYTIAIIGAKTGIAVNDSYFTYNEREWKDTFFKKFSITITNSNSTINVSLNRIVTQIELNIQDASSPHTRLYVQIRGELSAYSILQDKPTGGGVDEEYSLVVKPNPVFTFINTVSQFNIDVHITEPNDDDFRTIYNVTCQKDTRTIVSGNFFTAGGGNGFNIIINQAFAADTIKKGF